MGGFAYLVDFAHKFEDWDLEMLGKMILRCVLLHRLIRNTAAEVDRGGGVNGFHSYGDNIPAYSGHKWAGNLASLA